MFNCFGPALRAAIYHSLIGPSGPKETLKANPSLNYALGVGPDGTHRLLQSLVFSRRFSFIPMRELCEPLRHCVTAWRAWRRASRGARSAAP
jgi:hypothetical protein